MKSAIHISLGMLAILLAGCGQSNQQPPPTKAPRAVSVVRLKQLHPEHEQTMAGSVGSWKTEQIGFEVAGRVLHVLEPNAEIDGRSFVPAGENVQTEGTVLARVDDERYRIAEASAKAALDVAKLRLEVIDVDIKDGIPAKIRAAKAEQELAQAEFDRLSSLAARNTISKSELDRAGATVKTTTANVKMLEAELKAKRAESGMVEAQIEQARQQQDEAERDRRNTTLYPSFRGQVAQVHVVPGSYVAVGDPVLTVQMMDPMKVELELSAAMSRKFSFGDTVRLIGTDTNQQPIPLMGFVYRTDPVADPDTRTFTVTVLVRNPRVQPQLSPQFDSQQLARTKDLWPLDVEAIVGGGVDLLIESGAIRHDAEGAFVWKVTNRQVGDVSTRESRVLNVTKVRVTPSDVEIPFLGTWNFEQVAVNSGYTLDSNRDMVAGEITVDGGDGETWDGDQILLDRSGWLLRPGDLVNFVMPNGDTPMGYYVPMKAIRHESGHTSVFIADDAQPGSVQARRVEVRLASDTYSKNGNEVLRRIEAVGSEGFADGTRLIVDGVHFLEDGEAVAIVDRMEDVQ